MSGIYEQNRTNEVKPLDAPSQNQTFFSGHHLHQFRGRSDNL